MVVIRNNQWQESETEPNLNHIKKNYFLIFLFFNYRLKRREITLLLIFRRTILQRVLPSIWKTFYFLSKKKHALCRPKKIYFRDEW